MDQTTPQRNETPRFWGVFISWKDASAYQMLAVRTAGGKTIVPKAYFLSSAWRQSVWIAEEWYFTLLWNSYEMIEEKPRSSIVFFTMILKLNSFFPGDVFS